MKKLIIFLATILFGISTSFAQNSWQVIFSWTEDEENCACETYATAQYKIVISVYDDANDQAVGSTYTGYISYPASSYTHTFTSSPIDVEYYCNELNPENTPSFTIRCSVYFGHFSGIPDVHCSDSEQDIEKSCLNFSNGFNFSGTLYLE